MFLRKVLIDEPLETVALSESLAPQPSFTQKNVIAKNIACERYFFQWEPTATDQLTMGEQIIFISVSKFDKKKTNFNYKILSLRSNDFIALLGGATQNSTDRYSHEPNKYKDSKP
jgi:hypothetical protein